MSVPQSAMSPYSAMPSSMCAGRPSADRCRTDRAGKPHKLRNEQRQNEITGGKAKRQPVIDRHTDNAVDAFDIEPVSKKEQPDRLHVPHCPHVSLSWIRPARHAAAGFKTAALPSGTHTRRGMVNTTTESRYQKRCSDHRFLHTQQGRVQRCQNAQGKH